MAKAGRRAKSGKRTASGQLSRAGGRVKSETNVMRVALAQPHRAMLPDRLRRDQRAESLVGRMGLCGLLTAPQVEAAERLRRVMAAFSRELASPTTPTSMLVRMIAPGVEEEPKEEKERQKDAVVEDEAERRDRVLRDFDRAQNELSGALAGYRPSIATVMGLCVEDRMCCEGDLTEVRTALDALAGLWGLSEDKERGEPGARRMRIYAPGPRKTAWGRSEKAVAFVYEDD